MVEVQSLSTTIIETIQSNLSEIDKNTADIIKDKIDKIEFPGHRYRFQATCKTGNNTYKMLFVDQKNLQVNKKIVQNDITCFDYSSCLSTSISNNHFMSVSGEVKILYVIFKDKNENANEKLVKFRLSEQLKNKEMFATLLFYYFDDKLLFVFPIDKSNKNINYSRFRERLSESRIKFEDLRLLSALYCTDNCNFDESIITDLPNILKPDEIIVDSNSNSNPNNWQAPPINLSLQSSYSGSNISATTNASIRRFESGDLGLHQAGVSSGQNEDVIEHSVYEKSFHYLSRKRIKLFSYKLEYRRENESNSKKCSCNQWNPKYLNKCLKCGRILSELKNIS